MTQTPPSLPHSTQAAWGCKVVVWGWMAWACSVSLAATETTTSRQPTTRPNVLFLFADDMRPESISALGDPQVSTPNLDQLVQRGFVFRNAYCLGSSQPAVCNPSRNMLLSGNAYFRWQNTPSAPGDKQPAASRLAPAAANSWPQVLNAAGYQTYHHGKRGNTAPLIQAQFQHNHYLKNDEAERLSGEPGKEIVDAAINFLQDQRDERPFCMYLAFGNPHDPRVAAESYRQQYQADQLQLPANYRPLHPFNNGEMTVRDEQLLPWPRTEAAVRSTWADYYATITALDHHIGRLLTALDEQNLTQNTLVVFSADHGIALGSHGLLGKQNLYEHSLKAPLIFAGAGVNPGSSEALLYLLDIGPTICEIIGVNPPLKIDGRSAAEVIRGRRNEHRQELCFSYRHVQRAYRDSRWKLIRYPQVDVTQLFDLANDPHELVNLADRPEHQAQLQSLKLRLLALQQSLGDRQEWAVLPVVHKDWQPPQMGR